MSSITSSISLINITSLAGQEIGQNFKSPFIKSRVCGDYEKLYKMCVSLKSSVEELKKVRRQN